MAPEEINNKLQLAVTVLETLKKNKPVSPHLIELALKNLEEIYKDQRVQT